MIHTCCSLFYTTLMQNYNTYILQLPTVDADMFSVGARGHVGGCCAAHEGYMTPDESSKIIKLPWLDQRGLLCFQPCHTLDHCQATPIRRDTPEDKG